MVQAAKHSATWLAVIRGDWATVGAEVGLAAAEFQNLVDTQVKASLTEGMKALLPPKEELKESAQGFETLSKMVERLQLQMAGFAGEERSPPNSSISIRRPRGRRRR